MKNIQPVKGDNFSPRDDGIYEIRVYRLNPYDTTAVLWYSNTPDVVYGSDLSIFENTTEADFQDEKFLRDWIDVCRVMQVKMKPMDRTKFFLEEDNMVFTIGYTGVENG